MSSNPFDPLVKRRRSASELQADKKRMNLGSEIEALDERLGEVEQGQADTLSFFGYSDLIPIDDDEPPAPPENVTVIAVPVHELDVSWDAPVAGDHVVSSVLEVTPLGSSAFEVAGERLSGYVNDLEAGIEHTIRVKFVDRWGHESAWSAPELGTPLLTAAEYIDFAEAEIAGALGWANLDPLTDPDMLGDDVVIARAIATHDAAAFNLWATNAMIESAHIVEVVADKISTGTLTAADINLSASGRILAGATTFDGDGVELPLEPSFTAPSVNVDHKITGTGEFAALSFYEDTLNAVRGLALRTDGVAAGIKSNIAIHASRDGTLSNTLTGWLEVRSGGGTGVGANGLIFARPRIYVDGDIVIPSADGTLWAIDVSNAGSITTTNIATGGAGGTPQQQIFTIATGADDVMVYSNTTSSYPPISSDAVYANPGFSNSLGARRWFVSSTWSIGSALFKWNTSGLPDSATITSAVLRVNVTFRVNENARNLTADWGALNFASAPTDWRQDALTTALNTPIPASTGEKDFTLTNANSTNISRTGTTYLRLHISGGQPADNNAVHFTEREASSTLCARLIVNYTT